MLLHNSPKCVSANIIEQVSFPLPQGGAISILYKAAYSPIHRSGGCTLTRYLPLARSPAHSSTLLRPSSSSVHRPCPSHRRRRWTRPNTGFTCTFILPKTESVVRPSSMRGITTSLVRREGGGRWQGAMKCFVRKKDVICRRSKLHALWMCMQSICNVAEKIT